MKNVFTNIFEGFKNEEIQTRPNPSVKFFVGIDGRFEIHQASLSVFSSIRGFHWKSYIFLSWDYTWVSSMLKTALAGPFFK
jgi:hypothetical protein